MLIQMWIAGPTKYEAVVVGEISTDTTAFVWDAGGFEPAFAYMRGFSMGTYMLATMGVSGVSDIRGLDGR